MEKILRFMEYSFTRICVFHDPNRKSPWTNRGPSLAKMSGEVTPGKSNFTGSVQTNGISSTHSVHMILY